MGIAGFFLWLARWYPECIDSIDSTGKFVVGGGQGITPRSDRPDPRKRGGRNNNNRGKKEDDGETKDEEAPKALGGRYDNLYIDMNGLIHPCCHDTAPLPEPQSEEEMFERIFAQVDKLIDLVKPTKCLFLAVDGVAPRSKMNQQRARRFRAASEREEGLEIAQRMADVVVNSHQLPRPHVKEKWDHNVITPATAFMERVGQAIEWYIVKRLNDRDDPLWRHLTVIYSDAHVPGEGEHKIMHQIRALRAEEGYDPRTSHLIHGLDADLVCLSLMTHEYNIGVLRNVINGDTFQPMHDEFCVFNITSFRARLKTDFSNLGRSIDFERVVDDFIFLCFFIGNDFLPHIPLINIKAKGIETMLDHYVRCFDHFGHLTKNGNIYFDRLYEFLDSFIVEKMDTLFRTTEGAAAAKERAAGNVAMRLAANKDKINETLAALNPDMSNAQETSDQLLKLYSDNSKEEIRFVAGKHDLGFEYGAPGYRDQYYRRKFGWEFLPDRPDDGRRQWAQLADAQRRDFELRIDGCCHEYLKGCQWVMHYYTRGCPSWDWYYPFHYAPLLQDLTRYLRAGKVDCSMKLSEPLHPAEQLLAVLPRESVKALPEEMHQAVLDPNSVLGKFYPKGFHVDYAEATYSYQGVVQLPFINAKKLKKACAEVFTIPPDEGATLVFTAEDSTVDSVVKRLLAAWEGGSSNVLVPTEPMVVRTAPLAGRLGPFENAYPLHEPLECPEHGIIDSPSGIGQPIAHNRVKCYSYEPNLHADYLQTILQGASRPRDDDSRYTKKAQAGRGGAVAPAVKAQREKQVEFHPIGSFRQARERAAREGDNNDDDDDRQPRHHHGNNNNGSGGGDRRRQAQRRQREENDDRPLLPPPQTAPNDEPVLAAPVARPPPFRPSQGGQEERKGLLPPPFMRHQTPADAQACNERRGEALLPAPVPVQDEQNDGETEPGKKRRRKDKR